MSSQSRDITDSESSEQEPVQAPEPTESCSGYVIEVVCTGCKDKRGSRILERHVEGDVEELGTFPHLCGSCGGVTQHNLINVYQEIREPPLGWVRVESSP